MDFIISGYNATWNGNTIIYLNETTQTNTIPETPANLTNNVNGRSAELSWNASNDNETPSAGLTYNLYLYNSTTGDTIMTSMSDENTGKLFVPKYGNTGHNTSWTIHNLPNGEYFWSVQAVDNSYAGSLFADENTFTINEVAIDKVDEISFEVYPNPANEKIFFNQKTNNKIKINIYNSQGILVDAITTEKLKTECNISHLNTGIYFYKITSKNNSTSGSFIKK
ncbi:MAG: T9SS type A sorting domain-containing protein [Bacteroidales bacterium]|nr:T9SS type A sorting domain-containing protein [Bacteroidales bacterium]